MYYYIYIIKTNYGNKWLWIYILDAEQHQRKRANSTMQQQLITKQKSKIYSQKYDIYMLL